MEYMENEYQKSASKKFPDKKFIIAICTTVLLVITILVTLVQLFDQNSNDVHIPQLHFIVNDEIYATIETNGNEVIKLPNNPAKDGYKFDGWYWDNNLWNRPFTANSLLDEPLSSDMSVYAKFTNINIEPPSQESIINELNKIPNVVAIEAATEYNDPNGQLNKDGGYIAHIYFSVDVIKQDDVYGITLVEKGTEAGGSIEIYRNQQDAEKRNTYLTTLDGTILSSGSHKVVGTCVVRTSDILTASLQNILENNLEKMLTGKTDYVNMDTYLIQIAKTIAQNENLSEFETVSKLIGYGYPQKKSEDIAKSCGVNFNETAKYLIEGYADYYATVSPAMVSTLLSERGFSDDNISYAIEKSNVDWKWYAQIHAREFIVMYSEMRVISPLDVINYLQAEKGYTKADSEYGITNDEISWDILAVNYINDFLLHNNLKTKQDYIEALANVNFTEQQIKYALDNCNIDWNTLALNNLSYYVENLCNTTPNYTQCLSKLKEWGFNDKEASYALQKYDNLIYPDKLDYVIHFNTDGGELSTLNQNVVFGKTYTLPTPTKTGYTFKGWYNGTNEVTAGTWYTASDVTLKAKWEITSYSITYNLNNGTNSSSNKSAYTTTDTVVLYPPTRRGYTFTGWTYSGQTTPIMNVTIQKGTTGNKTYTANWQANTYTVTYKVNGGTLSDLTVEVEYGSYFKPATPTRTGYSFNGWHYDSGKGYDEEYCNDYYGIAGDVTLEAWWNANTYTITYNANGGTVSGTTQSVAYDSTYTLRTPSREGYEFLGWYSGANKVENGTWMSTQGITLKAEWKANTYTITFNANNGTMTPTNATATYDSSITLPTPTRTGYVFSGWYDGNTEYTAGTWKIANNVTLTAKWTARTDIAYVVNHYQQNIYDDGYTLFETQNLTGTADATIKPNRNSYQGFSMPTQQTVAVKPDGSLVVKYYYARETYTLSFHTNGGEKVSSITAKYGASITLPTPTKEGMTFGGWYISSWFYDKAEYDTMPWSGRQLFARWLEETDPKDFEYEYDSNGITVTGYKGISTTLWIPTHIYGKPVIAISSFAFEKNAAINKVVVPETVTTIGEGAFKGCTSVVEITIPFVGHNESSTGNSSVFGYIFGRVKTTGVSTTRGTTSKYDTTDQGDTSYYSYGFAIPRSLRSVTITKQKSIPNNSFKNCDLIEEISIWGETTSIGENAFQNCATMKNIYIPNTVETIGEYAFKGCTSLTINCGAVSLPTGWASNWNSSNCTVCWNKSKA